MSMIKSGMAYAALWLALTAMLLAGCTAPAESTSPPTSAPAATTTLVQPPTATLDTELSAMIVDVSGYVTDVHDPTMIKADGVYYLINSVGSGLPIRCSKDMKVWDMCGRVFDANPDWVVKAIEGVTNLWAPEIISHDGTFYLFYSASTFGSNRSAIGLVTNTTLDPESPDYAWVDQGEVISSQKTDNYNAIDANLAFDQGGQPWLVFGSFWSGVKMAKVDPVTFKAIPSEELISLAAKPGTDAIEGGFITWREDYYYLFVSHDYCCKGVNSTYNIRVGRAKDITGPYLDRDNLPLTQGGGTLVYKGSDRWRGPGHPSIYIEGETYYMVYHSYDATAGGVPTLHIEALKWDSDGWPQSPSALMGK